MGLVQELLSGYGASKAEPKKVVVESAFRMQREQDEWVEMLRRRGVKAAHPDDYWSKNNKLHFCYQQFNDGAEVGDLVALGSPWLKKSGSRIVKITRREDDTLLGWTWWHFEEVERGVF